MATTTETMEQMGKTAEVLVRSVQQSAQSAMDYTVKAQEVNTELLRKTTELWIQGLRKQTELSQDMSQEFFEKAEDQAHVYQNFYEDFYKRWSFPFAWMPYDPFAFWRQWTESVQKRAWVTQKTVQGTQKTAAEETARVIETTAPGNGSFPIAGYDEMNVREIMGRLDTLTDEQLRRVKDYERRHKNRETLLHEIDRKLGVAS